MRRLFVAIFLLSATAFAGDALSRLRADYEQRVLLIRGFYQDSQLHYDATGQLTKSARPGSWTTAFVYINSLDIDNGKVILKTSRVVQIFDSKKQVLAGTRTKMPVVIEIEADATNEAAVRQLLDKIFIDRQEPLAQLIPDYWGPLIQRLADDGTLGPEPKQEVDRSKCDSSSIANGPCSNGKAVKAPRITSAPEPDYNLFARSINLEGTVVLGTVVDETGHAVQTRVIRPVGCGLDDKAVEILKRWTFQPATRDGQPVRVQINVEINFRLH